LIKSVGTKTSKHLFGLIGNSIDDFEFDGSASGGSSDSPGQTKNGSGVRDPEKMTDEEIYLAIQKKLEGVLAQKKGCQNKLKFNELTTGKLTEEWETNYAIKNCTFCKKQYSPFNNGPVRFFFFIRTGKLLISLGEGQIHPV
jgi:hypothetical protein